MKKAHVLMIVVGLIVLVSIPLIMMAQNMRAIEESQSVTYDLRLGVWQWELVNGSPRGPIGTGTFSIEFRDAEGEFVDRLTTREGEARRAMMMSLTTLCQHTITVKGLYDFEPLTLSLEDFVFNTDDSEWHQWSTSYVLTMTSGSPDPEIYWQLDIELGPKTL